MSAHFTPPPPAAISRVLSSFDRDQLAGFIAVAIDLLDLADGDADDEEGGDDEPPEAQGDTADMAWIEWDRRGARKVTSAGYEGRTGAHGITEDDEADGDEEDGNFGEDDFCAFPTIAGPGCPLADPGGNDHPYGQEDDEPDGAHIRRPHRDRIRRDACTVNR